MQGVHGQGLLSSEAVPADLDGDVRRAGRREPERRTQAGKKVLEQDPDSPGSLGIAISEAVEDAATRDDTKYSLGSVLNHVLMHQTVIGLETKKQLEQADAEADVIVGCIGGGSNFAGFSSPSPPTSSAASRRSSASWPSSRARVRA